MLKLIIFALLISPALSACRVLGEMGTRHSHCEDTAVIRAESPDGRYVASVFHRRCGPEGSESLYTYAEVKEVPPHFWSDPTAGRNLADLWGFRPLSVRWEGPRRLVIVTPNLQEVDPERKGIAQDTFWKDVEIHYE